MATGEVTLKGIQALRPLRDHMYIIYDEFPHLKK